MMNFEKYTNSSKKIINSAQNLALGKKHQKIAPIHIINELLNSNHEIITKIFEKININNIKKNISELLLKEPINNSTTSQIYADPKLLILFESAEKIAKTNQDSFVSIDTLLLSCIKSDDQIESILKKNGLTHSSVKSKIEEFRKDGKSDNENSDDNFNALEKYTINVTQKAHNRELDPVIGRDEEIRRTIQVLSRRTKNNPILIGDPGVGKTALIEGLAQRIVNKDVPRSLENKVIRILDLGLLLAGAKYRGEFEERLQNVLKEIHKHNGSIILFIDEIHTLVGAGKTDGAMDASNMLKPALARGELHMIGATTLDEYRQYIEKDAALARRYQTVLIDEPTMDDAVSILRGLKRTTIPSTNATLAILEPTIFPSARSGYPIIADCTLTTSSGAEVAKETTVIPIMNLGIFSFIETAREPSNKYAPPLIRKNRPKISAKVSIFK